MSEAGVHRDDSGSAISAVIDRPSGRRRSDRIVGGGRATQEAVDQALAVARSERPVLLVGPAGVGKEHLARAIHEWSGRQSGPFVVVACTGVAPGLQRHGNAQAA